MPKTSWMDIVNTWLFVGFYFLFCVFQILEKVGFVNVKAEDRTSLFIEVLSKELKKMETVKDEFLQVCNFRLKIKLIHFSIHANYFYQPDNQYHKPTYK